MGFIYNLFDVVGRILISVMFLESGIGKIKAYASTAQSMQSHGIPAALLPLVIATEIVCSVGVIIGFKTRLFAFLLAGFCILAPSFYHTKFADPTQYLMFMKDLAIAGGFLVICARGAGAFSLDKKLS